LPKLLQTFFSTARSVITSFVANALIRVSGGHQLENLALPRCQLRDRIVSPFTREQCRDDLRVEGGAAFAHAPDRRDELVDVPDRSLRR